MPIENNGSVILYSKYIRPRFLQHQNQVDDLLNNITNQGMLLSLTFSPYKQIFSFINLNLKNSFNFFSAAKIAASKLE